VKTAYAPTCVYDNMQIWLPAGRGGSLHRELSAIGCQ